MKLNKNGWGTTQMLLLSAGIFVALLVAVYFISKLYGSFNLATANKKYADLEANLASAAKKYVIENNVNIEDSAIIYSDILESLGYLKDFNDSDNYPCAGYVIVSKVDFINDYKAYITCKNYKTTN